MGIFIEALQLLINIQRIFSATLTVKADSKKAVMAVKAAEETSSVCMHEYKSEMVHW